MKGNTYSNEKIKGKFLILKCWFIGCTACVAEFPELNEIVASYKSRKDILFVSLASDPKENLVTFLSKKSIDYMTVPNARKYMTEDLGIQMYPTHIIVNKEGVIIKAVNKASELKEILARVIN